MKSKSNILDEIKYYLGYKLDKELAEHLDVKPNVISNWRKRNSFDVELIMSKCEFVNPNYLITGQGELLVDEKYHYDTVEETQAEYKTNGKAPPECKECLALKRELEYKDKLIEVLEDKVKILKQANEDLRSQATYQDNNQKKNAS